MKGSLPVRLCIGNLIQCFRGFFADAGGDERLYALCIADGRNNINLRFICAPFLQALFRLWTPL
jgi:hypothetical protein